jgi:hypothetical protein
MGWSGRVARMPDALVANCIVTADLCKAAGVVWEWRA